VICEKLKREKMCFEKRLSIPQDDLHSSRLSGKREGGEKVSS
jgi:hypothetical protein